MPFDPNKPVDHAPLDSAVMRDQLQGLQSLMQIGDNASLAASAQNSNATISFDQPFADPQLELFREAFNALVVNLQRTGAGLPGKPTVTVDGLGTPTQTGHVSPTGGTIFTWFLRTATPGSYAQIGFGPNDFVEMSGLTGPDNFLICVASNEYGPGPASDPVQFQGGV